MEIISNMHVGCSLPGFKTSMIAYGDDLIFLSHSAAGLQSMLDSLDCLLINLCLIINHEKSSYFLFRHRGNKISGAPNIMPRGVKLNKVSSCKCVAYVVC